MREGTRSAPRAAALSGLLATGLLLISLAACTSDAQQPTAATPDPRATLSAGARWAENVCYSARAVTRSLRGVEAATAAVPSATSTPAATVPPFAKSRGDVLTRIGAAAGATQTLAALVDRAPGPRDAALGRAAESLQDPAARTRAAYLRLADSTSDLAATTVVADLRAAVDAVAPSLNDAVAQARHFDDRLEALATTGDPAVREAFAAAPSCARYVG